MARWLWLSAFVTLFSLVSCFLWYEDPLGAMFPVNKTGDYVLTGQQLQLECRLNRTSSYNSSEIFIEKGTGFNTSLTITDQWSVQTNYTVTSLEDAGNYECYVGDSMFVDSVKVEVEYYPRRVTNISCILYNWDEWMKCMWDLEVDYNNMSNIDVSCFYKGHSDGTHTCPNPTRTSCFWEFNYYLSFSMIVIVKNRKANVQAKGAIVTIERKNTVKPAPVSEFRYNRTARSVTLFWRHDKISKRKIYRLRYKRTRDFTFQEILIESNLTLGEIESPHNHTVTDLHPFAKYTFKIDVKPWEDRGYWSDKKVIEVTTLQSVPEAGPVITKGSYSSFLCRLNGYRDVAIFWKQPRPSAQNGIIAGYQVHCGNKTSHDLGRSVYMFTCRNISCDTESLKLYARTEVGWSENYSHIIVPAEKKRISLFDYFFILQNQTGVQAHWQISSPNTASCTIYWRCSKEPRECEGNLSWKKVECNQQQAVLPLSGIEDYVFGISASTNGTDMGIKWAECAVRQGASPHVKPQVVRVQRMNLEDTLLVRWDNSRCLFNDQAFITSYKLYIGIVQTRKVNNLRQYTFNLSHGYHEEHHLDKGKNYSFQVQALSASGDSQLSDPVFERLPDDSFIANILPVILAVSVGSFVILLCCVVYAKRKCFTEKEQVIVPKMSPNYSPSRNPLLDDSSFSSSSCKSTHTVEYTDIRSSFSRTSTNSESDSHPIHLTDNADVIQVIVQPQDPSVGEVGRVSQYITPDELTSKTRTTYSLFSPEAPVTGDYIAKDDMNLGSGILLSPSHLAKHRRGETSSKEMTGALLSDAIQQEAPITEDFVLQDLGQGILLNPKCLTLQSVATSTTDTDEDDTAVRDVKFHPGYVDHTEMTDLGEPKSITKQTADDRRTVFHPEYVTTGDTSDIQRITSPSVDGSDQANEGLTLLSSAETSNQMNECAVIIPVVTHPDYVPVQADPVQNLDKPSPESKLCITPVPLVTEISKGERNQLSAEFTPKLNQGSDFAPEVHETSEQELASVREIIQNSESDSAPEASENLDLNVPEIIQTLNQDSDSVPEVDEKLEQELTYDSQSESSSSPSMSASSLCSADSYVKADFNMTMPGQKNMDCIPSQAILHLGNHQDLPVTEARSKPVNSSDYVTVLNMESMVTTRL